LLVPAAIVLVGLTYGPESERGMDTPWSEYAIDFLFWADACFTALLIWMMRGWRWLAAVVSIPLLGATGVLAVLNAMWVSGNYL